MRFLLTPITMIIWFLLTYWGLYYAIVFMIWMFTLSWFWLILGYSFLFGIISFFVSSLPTLINLLLLKFYKCTWFSVITHSAAGILGIIAFYFSIFQNPPEAVGEKEIWPILVVFWNISWLKTILLIFPLIALQLSLVFQGVFSPIMMKLDNSNKN